MSLPEDTASKELSARGVGAGAAGAGAVGVGTGEVAGCVEG